MVQEIRRENVHHGSGIDAVPGKLQLPQVQRGPDGREPEGRRARPRDRQQQHAQPGRAAGGRIFHDQGAGSEPGRAGFA